MKILGISAFYHDAAAALVDDGQLVAAVQEERFSRLKNDSRFPSRSIRFCLERAGIEPYELDAVAFYERPLLKLHRTFTALRWCWPRNSRQVLSTLKSSIQQNSRVRDTIANELGVATKKILFVPHHLSHAGSAFLPSGMSEAAILTVDGVGEWSTAAIFAGSSSSTESSIRPLGEIEFPHSLGLLYSTFTQFCGFAVNDGEYKLMGLAAYGSPRHVDKVRQVVDIAGDGSFRLNLRFFNFLKRGDAMYSSAFTDLFGEPSPPNDGSIDHGYADIAASIQQVIEEVLLLMAAQATRLSGSRRLCLAGGVALNSVAMGRLSREAGLDEIFIQPAAGDAGGALGAALYAHYVHFGAAPEFVLEHASWGPSYADDQVEAALRDSDVSFERVSEPKAAERASEMLAAGQVIALHQGRSEWGPRALGNRSILADPRPAKIKDIVNARVKYREAFRPFAPAILQKHVADYFDFDPRVEPLAMRFMSTVHPYRGEKGSEVQAVNHEGTGRLQAVGAQSPALYRRIIKQFSTDTGTPMVLNTSFNVRGEPLVESPVDALRTFANTGIDALFIGSYVAMKSEKRPAGATAASDTRQTQTEDHSTRRTRPSHRQRPGQTAAVRRELALEELLDAVPVLASYVPAEVAPHPYLFRADRPLQETDAYRTDRLGFRHTRVGDDIIDCDNWSSRPSRGLLIGSSTAFGHGASNDEATVASLLSASRDVSMLNVAVRGATSTHELMAATYFANDAHQLIILSGFNNLAAALVGSTTRTPFSPLWAERVAGALGQIRFDSLLGVLTEGAGSRSPDTNAVVAVSAESAVALAADAHRRDLAIIRSIAPSSARVSFALQPVAGSAKRRLDAKEQQAFDALAEYRPSTGELADRVSPLMIDYAAKLAEACEQTNVDFVDLNQIDYDGFCFLDAVHLTDLGNQHVASALADSLW